MRGESRRAGRLARLVILAAMLAVFREASCSVSPGTVRPLDRRPNFVIILGDDVGRNDLGPYGHPHIRTPNLMRLSALGIRFDRAFLSISSCSPARCSILTGRYPHSAGATDAHHPLRADQVSLVETLRAAGYFTESVGKWHLGQEATGRFDRVVRDNDASGGDHWVAELKARPQDRPFFFWLASNDAHRPYERLPEYPHYRYNDIIVPAFLPDMEETRTDFGMYYEEITRLDDFIGRVMEELVRQKALANTFVVFLSDDGRPFPRCKTTLYDSGINTPFIVSFPSVARPGGRSLSLVSVIDLAPTLIELAGLKIPPTMQGKSLVPILKDPGAGVRDRIFAEQNWHDYCARKRAVRTERYKYIKNSYPDLPDTPPVDAVRSLTFQAMRRLNGWDRLPPQQKDCFLQPRPSEELYDVLADPNEVHNLAGDPEHGTVLTELRRSLAEWQRDTDDREPAKRRPDEYDRQTGAALPGTTHPPEH